MADFSPLKGPLVLPRSGQAPRSMVVLLHGYGSNGDDLIGLVPYWQGGLPDTVFLAPHGRQACPGAPAGYQWWNLTSTTPEAMAAGVRDAAPAINAYIDSQLAHYGLADDKLALVGFSQGTMAALHIGPRRKRRLAGIVGYSGMLADPDAPGAELPNRPPVLLVHGDADPVLPVAALHQAKAALDALGFETATHISPGLGHSVDDAGLRLGEEFLARVLA